MKKVTRFDISNGNHFKIKEEKRNEKRMKERFGYIYIYNIPISATPDGRGLVPQEVSEKTKGEGHRG